MKHPVHERAIASFVNYLPNLPLAAFLTACSDRLAAFGNLASVLDSNSLGGIVTRPIKPRSLLLAPTVLTTLASCNWSRSYKRSYKFNICNGKRRGAKHSGTQVENGPANLPGWPNWPKRPVRDKLLACKCGRGPGGCCR